MMILITLKIYNLFRIIARELMKVKARLNSCKDLHNNRKLFNFEQNFKGEKSNHLLPHKCPQEEDKGMTSGR